ncbi:MAG: acyl-CoA thioester hydrolase [Gammaproteobacteria bacterium]|jgi:acyl-CoA thioester hydrolase
MGLEKFKEQYPFVIKDKVQWGELDAFLHVNNTVYFRYFERVRFAYFEEFGLLENFNETGIGPILASTQCRFRTALEYPDTIYIGTYITNLKEDRFLMKYGIYSENQDLLAAEGDGFIIYFNYKKKAKTLMPDSHLLALKKVTV